jgi:hypothetical protein
MSAAPITEIVPVSLRSLLTGLIDYAGLFPPAALDMNAAVLNYSRYLAGPDAWALGRFVLPVARFGELERSTAGLEFAKAWTVSALLGAAPEAELSEIGRFNQRNTGKMQVDTVEAKAGSADEIQRLRRLIPDGLAVYFEIPMNEPAELLRVIRDVRGRAKIRTGGVTAEAIPQTEMVAGFLATCAEVGVAFKATAGLHHPVRCSKPLTYAADAPSASMHGFLNLFLAAVFAQRGTGRHELAELLGDSDASNFGFDDLGARWGERAVNLQQIQSSRERFAISFGSCSFEEPLSELRAIKLL